MKNKNTSWVFFALSAGFFSIGWAVLWSAVSAGNLERFFLLATLFFLGLIFACFFILLTKSKKETAVLAGVCLLGSIALGFGHWLGMFGLAVFCWSLFLLGIRKIKEDQDARISVDVYLSLRRGISFMSLALSLLISGSFYFSLVEKQETSKVVVFEIKIPQKVTDKGIGLLGFFASGKNFNLISRGVTVDEYIEESFISQQEKDAGFLLPKDGLDVPAEERDFLLQQGRKMLSVQFGTELMGTEKMNEVVNSMLEKRVNEFFRGQSSEAPLLPFGAAIALFFAVSSIFWLMGFVILWTAVILLYILLKLQFVVLNKETKEVQTIDV